ncbi:hypothetical protein [Nocardioides panaciterrulae]|uniref:Pyruvate/2-oxoglutarate dehydrogenase complex dihydrolipoamide acyltransferase (E2) component n=1 Tax=Nocardioides panaciterrulae TaxID=661492 RepID=A0A7Y9E944_9ACTN|nr:hypothetical protein [Nocardioides panaciterrulae]NYD43277.1 pyruvate/2-oxoglutarate dehydrogenase complex dihydrolipoamide acyltransferase (E2) component [Nocardioides panaciterrulae]
MRRISAWILALAVVAGAAGSAVAYAHTSPGLPPDAGTPAAATSAVRQQPDRAPRPARPVTKVRWAPCPRHAHLEHGVCVVDVVHTVVLPAPPSPRAAPAAPATSTTAAAATAGTATASRGARATAATAARPGEDGEDGEPGERGGEHAGGEDGPAGHAGHDD